MRWPQRIWVVERTIHSEGALWQQVPSCFYTKRQALSWIRGMRKISKYRYRLVDYWRASPVGSDVRKG